MELVMLVAGALVVLLTVLWTDRLEQNYRRTILAQNEALRVMDQHIEAVQANNVRLRRIVHSGKVMLLLHETVEDKGRDVPVWLN